MENSPLAQASPDSLNELFSRDPLQLADSDLLVMVRELRRMREQWKLTESKPAKGAPKVAASLDIKLGDIGL